MIGCVWLVYWYLHFIYSNKKQLLKFDKQTNIHLSFLILINNFCSMFYLTRFVVHKSEMKLNKCCSKHDKEAPTLTLDNKIWFIHFTCYKSLNFYLFHCIHPCMGVRKWLNWRQKIFKVYHEVGLSPLSWFSLCVKSGFTESFIIFERIFFRKSYGNIDTKVCA